MKTLTDEFIEALTLRIDSFCKLHKMTLHRFGLQAINDHRIARKIASGNVTPVTTRRVEMFMMLYDVAEAQKSKKASEKVDG